MNSSKVAIKNSREKYPLRLNMYDRPPAQDVTLEEFETWAIDRLKVLSEIESSFVRNRTHDELKTVTTDQCRKYLPVDSNNAELQTREPQRKKDHVSHFILRLAFCRSEELRRRFVKAETTLFRVRYENSAPADREKFIEAHNVGGDTVDVQKDPALLKQLQKVAASAAHATLEKSYYKVPWTQVPDLVATRRVYLKGGFAYVPLSLQPNIIYQKFQQNLERALEQTAKALPRLDEDDRLVPILEHLSKGFVAGVSGEYRAGEGIDGEVTADMVDEIARKHFPMCMRSLHETLRADRHLKHAGRLQFTLFLKAMGVSVEEAIVFWRKGYGQSMTDDKFNKEYKYNIRHSYGLEGKRADYPAMNCQRIITQNGPGPGETHGCPFCHHSIDNLTSSLTSVYRITAQADLMEIQRAVKDGFYHVACTRVFEITHAERGVKKGEGLGAGESVAHPNKYVARSRELEKAAGMPSGAGDAMMVDEA
ncbi:hypothetical protein BOTBODRAFT_31695 [Botryobasidium botryosum FD-172 SS1]|uniref:DNA primase large subunit n=1 Tax=Botryobasidium botryosum (strain FD-172 SS1) TaxID=930990 RepID=A0A067MHZ5_BOTB1|nr:hypothetical protein BOTBODRAFT_31695 [Botryobasidium botryosum FD-172 SS1]